jgi:DNA-binding MarR family transcriptional regulator
VIYHPTMTTARLPRVTASTLRVLQVLLKSAGCPDAPGKDHLEHRGEIYALALARSANVRVGSVYPILARLEKYKWITGRWEEENPALPGRPRRRFYRLTDDGVDEAQRLLRERRGNSANEDQKEEPDKFGVEACWLP